MEIASQAGLTAAVDREQDGTPKGVLAIATEAGVTIAFRLTPDEAESFGEHLEKLAGDARVPFASPTPAETALILNGKDHRR